MADKEQCPHCGEDVKDGICQNCGASVPRMPEEERQQETPAQ